MTIYLGVTVGNASSRRVGGGVVLDYNKESASITALMHVWPPSYLKHTLIERVWSFWGPHQTRTYDDFHGALVRQARKVYKKACYNALAGIQRRLQS
jgi:hypothetical protein